MLQSTSHGLSRVILHLHNATASGTTYVLIALSTCGVWHPSTHLPGKEEASRCYRASSHTCQLLVFAHSSSGIPADSQEKRAIYFERTSRGKVFSRSAALCLPQHPVPSLAGKAPTSQCGQRNSAASRGPR